MILIDYSPVIMASAFTAWSDCKKSPAIGNFETVLELYILQRLRTAVQVGRKNLGPKTEVIVAKDNRPYWRATVFPGYKKNRKPLQKDSDIPWTDVFKVGNALAETIDSTFGWKVIDVAGAEADDIIGTLIHRSRCDAIIVSRDGDFKQLHRQGVKQYDIIAGKFIKETNPQKFLHMKLITGDKKDGVPNILSNINTFITEGLKQEPLRKAKMSLWENLPAKEFCNGPMLERYTQNQELLDLYRVPDKLKDNIMNEFNTPTVKGNIYQWLVSRRHGNLISFIKDFE
jgi:hypothetical protein